jgi:hypothetical protein
MCSVRGVSFLKRMEHIKIRRKRNSDYSLVSPLEMYKNGNQFLHEILQAGRHKFPVQVN